MMKRPVIFAALVTMVIVAGSCFADDGGAAGSGGAVGQVPQGETGTGELVKYLPPTKAENEAEIAEAKEDFAHNTALLELSGTVIETSHFIIWTNWDPQEYGFLKKNLELAYSAVSRQFDMSPSDNIFIGKLPVYMFSQQKNFEAFAVRLDHVPEDMASKYAGYYWGRSDGMGHMVMWKPDIASANGNVELAKRIWAYVLVHEFTHSFVARYISNVHIPTWLNEGIAEVIANHALPGVQSIYFAKLKASQSEDISSIFTDTHPGGDWYPVMRTLAETLIVKNHRAFLQMFKDMKAGKTDVEALQDNYHWDLDTLTQAWRYYVLHMTAGEE